ncbi:MAG: ABC transporter permease subunit [Butyrivibrio sp.]|nr:ABC transporter permease subunit [Acetatifactor muris]MCM1561186.1 ABC transporter permease subunit [Butyrivibrio sp.]
MREEKSRKEKSADKIYIIQRIAILLAAALIFFPAASPSRICTMINKNLSLFTSGISYGSLTGEMGRAFTRGWLDEGIMILLFAASLIMLLGIAAAGAGGCMSLGNLKFKKLGNLFSLGGSAVQLLGLVLIYVSYLQIQGVSEVKRVGPMFPKGFIVYAVLAVLILAVSVVLQLMLPKPEADSQYEMDSKFKLFLMFLPFAALCFVFSYLPLWGWRYAFFDYSAGGTLSMDNFVGFRWFTSLFQSEATRADVVRVLRNTLAMSGLGIATSWFAMAFAIFLNEIKNIRFRRFVQTFTTIPNFISWVLVYAIAFALFSTDGFVNTMASQMGILAEGVTGTNYLMSSSHIWLKMLAWGVWKGIGWSAIIYIAGISGIDQQLYEAATVDGAGRFARMWHVTLPGLIPTYCVMLLMSIANILSNGMDQYYVFRNQMNTNTIEVLDLYVYNLGIQNGNIPLSTVIGMVKSVVSVILLFAANRISKSVRGESIV